MCPYDLTLDMRPSCGFGSLSWIIPVLLCFGKLDNHLPCMTLYNAIVPVFTDTSIADTEYSWNCASNGKGQNRIPDLDIYKSREIDFSNRNTLYIFSLSHLNDSCYGTITAIDYCYEYNGAGFNWTVLLLSNHFTVIETFHIENHSSIRQSYSIGGIAFQCDRIYIDGFDLPKGTDFLFGVTDSFEGGASLLAFHDTLYMVDAIVMPKVDKRISNTSNRQSPDKTRCPLSMVCDRCR